MVIRGEDEEEALKKWTGKTDLIAYLTRRPYSGGFRRGRSWAVPKRRGSSPEYAEKLNVARLRYRLATGLRGRRSRTKGDHADSSVERGRKRQEGGNRRRGLRDD